MVWNKNKKNIYPSMPQFHYIILVCEGLLIIGSCLLDSKKVAHIGAMGAIAKHWFDFSAGLSLLASSAYNVLVYFYQITVPGEALILWPSMKMETLCF